MKKRVQPKRARRALQVQLQLFDAGADEGAGRVILDALDEFLKDKPAWRDGFDFLVSNNIASRDALVVTWMSLSKKQRGPFKTREEFAQNVMGVCRAVTYQWESRAQYKLFGKAVTFDEMAEVLRLKRMLDGIGDVDETLHRGAMKVMPSPGWVRLYYQRAGVLEDVEHVKLANEGGQPLEIKRADELSDDELATIAGRGGRGAAEAA